MIDDPLQAERRAAEGRRKKRVERAERLLKEGAVVSYHARHVRQTFITRFILTCVLVSIYYFLDRQQLQVFGVEHWHV